GLFVGFWQGVVRQAVTLGAFYAAAVVSTRLYPNVAALLMTVANNMVPTVADKVRLISQEPEAWDLVRTSFAAALPSLEETIRDVARTASGRSVDGITPSILQATLKLFETFKADLLADLEIKGFEFTKPATTICPPVSVVAAPSPPPLKNKGGKPLAAHWDEMWACIAVQLWSGNLKPKSQADVKSAMFAWFNKSEIDVGETAVTERARQLWLKIVATQ
ncbi:MAG: hypothetical protein ABJA20_10530, partial [Novosphingobium sp.]